VPAAQRPAVFGAAAGGAGFAGLGLAASLADHLEEVGFAAPTAVQRVALPALLAGRDALVAAPTGSGKTLAYLAPLVHDLQARAAPPSALRAAGLSRTR
jgi:superfamily II DNA/RNA helicase